MGLGLRLKILQKISNPQFSIDRVYSSIDRALQKLNNNFLQLLDSKLTIKQTLSKSNPRLNVLIMVCQHIQNEVLIH